MFPTGFTMKVSSLKLSSTSIVRLGWLTEIAVRSSGVISTLTLYAVVFAGFATLGFVLQPLVMKKDLLAAGPDKVFTAVNAFYRAIFILHCSNALPLTGEFPL